MTDNLDKKPPTKMPDIAIEPIKTKARNEKVAAAAFKTRKEAIAPFAKKKVTSASSEPTNKQCKESDW